MVVSFCCVQRSRSVFFLSFFFTSHLHVKTVSHSPTEFWFLLTNLLAERHFTSSTPCSADIALTTCGIPHKRDVSTDQVQFPGHSAVSGPEAGEDVLSSGKLNESALQTSVCLLTVCKRWWLSRRSFTPWLHHVFSTKMSFTIWPRKCPTCLSLSLEFGMSTVGQTELRFSLQLEVNTSTLFMHFNNCLICFYFIWEERFETKLILNTTENFIKLLNYERATSECLRMSLITGNQIFLKLLTLLSTDHKFMLNR